MAEKKYNILKAASWYTIGNVMIKGVSFFVLPIFTHLMNTHEYGVYSVYSSYLSIIGTIVLLGLSSTVAVARYAKEVEFESYISTILIIPLAMTLLGILGVHLYIPLCGDILSMNLVLWDCLLVSSATGAVCGIISARLVIDGKYMLYMAYSGIHTIGNVLISLILCYTFFYDHDVHLARIYGSTLSNLVAVAFLLIATKTKFSIRKVCFKYAFIWGIPLLFHTLATVVLTQSDRIIIRYMDSYSAAGIYAVATTVVTIPLVIQQSFSQAWIPWFYGKLENKEYERIRWLNNRYIIGFGVIIACFMLVAPDIIHIFTEKSYWGSAYSLVPLAVSIFGELLYSIPVSVEYYARRTNFIMTATLISVVINVALDIVFVQLWGYHGAAYATILSKLLLFIIHYKFSRKLERESIFSNIVVLSCIVVLFIINVLVLLSIDIYLIRYCIVVFLVIPVLVYVVKNRVALIKGFRN
ncbi:MAG: oligosaccharide flippase family protein [Lachnospiraceae bacterium]|nr:oligosaccharide flippase family protein [Lachnospiraceae bacterium]